MKKVYSVIFPCLPDTGGVRAITNISVSPLKRNIFLGTQHQWQETKILQFQTNVSSSMWKCRFLYSQELPQQLGTFFANIWKFSIRADYCSNHVCRKVLRMMCIYTYTQQGVVGVEWVKYEEGNMTQRYTGRDCQIFSRSDITRSRISRRSTEVRRKEK